MAKIKASAYIKYKELGYVIRPIIRNTAEAPVTYASHSALVLPKGSQISGAKSQKDASKFNTFDDIIRIYALVPQEQVESAQYDIYIFGTGEEFILPHDAEKLTIVKESEGNFIFHIYWRLSE